MKLKELDSKVYTQIVETIVDSGLYPEKQIILAGIMNDFITSLTSVPFVEKIKIVLRESEKYQINPVAVIKLCDKAMSTPIRHLLQSHN